MIPAIIAAPAIQGIVGGVIGGVMNAFAPSQPTSAQAAFNPYLNRAALAPKAATPVSTLAASPTGTINATQWNKMSDADLQSLSKGLTGRHIDATDESGRTISGILSGAQPMGHGLALNIGGHLVAFSQLKQLSWSATAV